MTKKNLWRVLGASMMLVLLAPAILFWVYTRDLPTLSSLSDYRPKEVSRAYSDDGELIAQFYVERRTVVGKDQVPDHVLKAFLAAEDANFYKHKGLDYSGLVRAVIRGLARGGSFRGTSTITQQLVKTMITGPERTLRRKVREAVLTFAVEKELSKDDILNIYLNQIVFGRGNYGVEEAARAYFGKSVGEVDVAEAAILAGIPKNPEKYNPKADLADVKERQRYVLGQMFEKGFITEPDYKHALEKPIEPARDRHPFLGKAPHYAELVRRHLEAKYGVEKLQQGGLTVYTAANAELQRAAHQAVRSGLREVDKRHGFRGARVRLEPDQLPTALALLGEVYHEKQAALVAYRGKRLLEQGVLVWDLIGVERADFASKQRLKDKVALRPLFEGDEYVGVVDEIDNQASEIRVLLGGAKAVISVSGYGWARKYNAEEKTPPPRSASDVARRGDLVVVRVDKLARGKVLASLAQDPKVEGSLVAIDPHTRFVRAIVGGESLDQAGLIRASQSHRQPGSAFKGIIYTAAIAAQVATPATVCNDAPVVFRDQWTGESWKPTNFEENKYDGDIILRTALARSKNTCSVKLLERLGVDNAIKTAEAMGIESKLPANLTLALGSGDVTLLELVNAYTTLAAAGRFAEPVFVRKIVDRDGTVLEEHGPEPGEERVSPAAAYIVTQMLTAVVQEGTATRAKELGRPVAGKTGTTNEHRNAWFVGFTPELVMGAWVGFDDNAPMGHETGGSAALPIWLGAMRQVAAMTPPTDFLAPPGVIMARIDPATGMLALPEATDALELPFLPGTEPLETVSLKKDFFEEDQVQ